MQAGGPPSPKLARREWWETFSCTGADGMWKLSYVVLGLSNKLVADHPCLLGRDWLGDASTPAMDKCRGP